MSKEETGFINKYWCSECNENWVDVWSCACNDKCPSCNKEIEPYESTDVRGELQMNDIHKETAAKIFESPDGKTVYEREFGKDERILVETEADEKREAIQAHCKKLSAEMLEWQEEEFARWGKPYSDKNMTDDNCTDKFTDIDIGEDFQI